MGKGRLTDAHICDISCLFVRNPVGNKGLFTTGAVLFPVTYADLIPVAYGRGFARFARSGLQNNITMHVKSNLSTDGYGRFVDMQTFVGIAEKRTSHGWDRTTYEYHDIWWIINDNDERRNKIEKLFAIINTNSADSRALAEIAGRKPKWVLNYVLASLLNG
jgi:hypothetical protein